jgi:hypothetical protein
MKMAVAVLDVPQSTCPVRLWITVSIARDGPRPRQRGFSVLPLSFVRYGRGRLDLFGVPNNACVLEKAEGVLEIPIRSGKWRSIPPFRA